MLRCEDVGILTGCLTPFQHVNKHMQYTFFKIPSVKEGLLCKKYTNVSSKFQVV